MITDTIDNLQRYAVPKAESILRFIKENDCARLPDGQIDIEGSELFVRVMSYTSKPASENRFETHRRYADVQYLVSGAELMQTARAQDLAPLTEYDSKGDYHFFTNLGPSTDVIVQSGEFTVFYPNEAHRPSCAFDGYRGIVKKLVFKVKMI